MMQLAATAVMVVFNVKIQFYGGVTAVAAYGIINRLMMLIFMPVVGISMGAQPILGFNFGARKYDRVLHTLRLALLAATGVSVLGFIIAEVFPQEIIRIFNDSPDLLRVHISGDDARRRFFHHSRKLFSGREQTAVFPVLYNQPPGIFPHSLCLSVFFLPGAGWHLAGRGRQ